MRVLAAIALVLIAIGGGQSPAQGQQARGRLHLMDTATAAAGATVVRFDLAGTPGRVSAIRLIAKTGSVVIARVIVTYANGQVHYEERERPINLREGERTAEIDPRLEERFIESVEVIIASASGAVELELHVRQTPEARAAQRDGAAERSFGTARERSVVGPEKPWVEVEVFYGTNRRAEKPRIVEVSNPKPEKRTLLSFGPTPEPGLSLGRAVVTIPRERTQGEINTPGTFDVLSYFRGQDMTREFTLLAVDRMGEDEFKAATRARVAGAKAFPGQAFVFVHGYNVSFDDAVFRTAQLAHDMEFDGLPAMFSWPSAGSLVSYFLDQRRWPLATDALRTFLDLVSKETGATTIHLIAHSMGANPMIETLVGYAGTPTADGKPRFSELILAAPDMTVERFQQLSSRVRSQARGITLFASSKDWALLASRTFTLGVDPVGYVVSGVTPTVTSGVDTIDISEMNTRAFELGHSTFADRKTLISDMKALLLDQKRREPSARLPQYRPLPAGSSKYWRYAP